MAGEDTPDKSWPSIFRVTAVADRSCPRRSEDRALVEKRERKREKESSVSSRGNRKLLVARGKIAGGEDDRSARTIQRNGRLSVFERVRNPYDPNFIRMRACHERKSSFFFPDYSSLVKVT